MARQNLTEAGSLGKIAEAKSDGSYKIQVISPGIGSSGYYSPEVLEAAAKAKVWGKGTHVYFDHPTATENAERAERSVKDLAAVLAEDASWNGSALVASITPVSPLGKAVLENEAFRSAVGVSVRASAEGEVGEVGGRTVWIVNELLPGTFNSVDLVTHAGRGGMILEAARRASEATNNDRSQQLSDAVRDKYGAEKKWLWIRDFDDTRVWFEENSNDDQSQTFEQTYTVDDGDLSVTLTGSRTEVRVRTEYVPIKQAAESAPPNVPVHPAGQSTTTKEHTMPEIEEGATVTVKETRLHELEEAHGRVPVLEAKVASETQRADLAEQSLAEEKAKSYAREVGIKRVREANSELPAATVEKIVAEAMRVIPLTEADKAADRRLDIEAFGKQVDEARTAEETYLATVVENGGTVRGLGPVGEKKEVTRDDSQRAIDEAFGRKPQTQEV